MPLSLDVTRASATTRTLQEVEARPVAPAQYSRLGAKGDRVTQLQSALKALGFLKGKPTGTFGQATEAALKAFQKSAGMAEHGIYGPKSKDALQKALAAAYAKKGPKLTVGERGRAVLRLESRLVKSGLLKEKADGNFTAATAAAVKRLEKKLGLEQDGIVDNAIWKELGGSGGGSGPGLKEGASGAAVKTLQRALKASGRYAGPVDGDFGDQTRKALVAFEKQNGLEADGVADASVWRALGVHVTSRTVIGGPRLAAGSRGAAVRILQTKLKARGIYKGPIDGKYGATTAAAVKTVQRQRGLEATGKVGNALWISLGGAGAGSGPVLKQGANGQVVSVLQQRLKRLGVYKGPVDGDFGPMTRAAVAAFEKKQGMTADGVVTNKVWAKLRLHVVRTALPASGAAGLPEPKHDYRRVHAASGQLMNVRTRQMLRRAESFAKSMGVKVPVWIVQGSYTSAVSASGGTHDQGGALDISTSGRSVSEVQKLVKALRMAGFAAWKRGYGDDNFTQHIHAIAIGDRQLSSAARNQVAEYFRGGDGLVGSARDGDSEVGRPWPKWANKYR